MIIKISDTSDADLSDFFNLTDVQLRKSKEVEEGLYLAESTNVIQRAIAAGHEPRAFLLLEQWLTPLESVTSRFPDAQIYIGSEQQLEAITGFHMHRGAIASMKRPEALAVEEILQSSRFLVVLDNLADHTNVGAIFRSVAALGADGVLLSAGCADPLYRRSVRVSMGAVFEVPWARLPDWRVAGPLLKECGYTVVGMGLDQHATELGEFVQQIPERLAIVLGSEGPGLSRQARGACTELVKIDMDHGVDSLNVASAAAVMMWAVRHARRGSAV